MVTVAEAVSRIVSVEEYLNTSYRPDRELIDGRLEEKPMPTRLHGFVRALISQWFLNHTDEWGTLALSEVRTRVRPSDFRLPDVAVVRIGTKLLDEPMDQPPLIAIEVMSKRDTFAALRDRASDLARMGVDHVWLVDPKKHEAYVFTGGAWQPTTELQLPGSPTHLDLAWLWARVEKYS